MDFTEDLQHLNAVWQRASCLQTADEVSAAIDRLAAQITRDLKQLNPLVVCVMNGGLIFCGQLLVRLPFGLQFNYLQVSRYRNETHGGELKWLAQLNQSVKDRHILLVDDILDEGDTLIAVTQWLCEQEASSVRTAVLVDKQHARKRQSGYTADYTGFEMGDEFLFGCGMDYQGYFRNLNGIYAVPTAGLVGDT